MVKGYDMGPMLVLFLLIMFIFLLLSKKIKPQLPAIEETNQTYTYVPFNVFNVKYFNEGGKYKINYIDFSGKKSSREIEITAIDETDEYEFRIYAICKLRKEEREFVSSRIQDAIDLSSGEVIPVKKLFSIRY